jgi:hypothetical protein
MLENDDKTMDLNCSENIEGEWEDDDRLGEMLVWIGVGEPGTGSGTNLSSSENEYEGITYWIEDASRTGFWLVIGHDEIEDWSEKAIDMLIKESAEEELKNNTPLKDYMCSPYSGRYLYLPIRDKTDMDKSTMDKKRMDFALKFNLI